MLLLQLLLPLPLLPLLLLLVLLLLQPLLSLHLPLPLPMVHGDGEEGVVSEQTWGVDEIRASRFMGSHGCLRPSL